MNKTLSLVAASLITIGVGGALSPAQAQAREIDCVNYWVNPETQLAQCFDKQLNFVATPFNYFSRTINTDSNTLVRRQKW